jgi:MFS family permease
MSVDRSSPGRRPYYGWTMLLLAAAAMVGTLPGRTQGLGLITEPLLADLGIDRVAYAQLNFWATLLGASGALGIGRLLDRFGSRVVLTSVALALGTVVCAMSQAAGFAALAIGVTLTRALGQSALSVVSLAIVGRWFVRRIDIAMAIYSVVMSIGFMVAFPLMGAAIQWLGWRQAWLLLGLALVAGLAPVASLLARRSPETIGLQPDGGTSDGVPAAGGLDGLDGLAADRFAAGAEEGYTWQQAVRYPAFWVFAGGAALYGLVASGIGLFNESILAERDFGPEVYYQSLVVTAMAALIGNFGGGWLAQTVRLGGLLAASLLMLTIGLLALPHLDTTTHVMLWAAAMGLGGGVVMVLFFSVWPRVFGRRHLGRIQGIAQAMTVVASALGPLLLAWCVDWTGSYAAMFRILAVVIALTAAAAFVVSIPGPPPRPVAAWPLRADPDPAA